MDLPNLQLHPNHLSFLESFIKACEVEERVAAAILVGSYVKGSSDEHSDLDLYLIITDESYNDFITDRSAFVEKLGEPLFMEDFDHPNIIFLIFSDGSEVEISFAREDQLSQVLDGPYKVLLDKNNITSGITLRDSKVDQEEQTEKLRLLVYGFWHELAHFTTALARGELWWAQGQLGALRLHCINLVRLQNDFSDQEIGEEGYFKIDTAIPIEQLSSLKQTYCPMEGKAMGRSALMIVRFFQNLAPDLASKHGITYPARLEHVMVEKLKKVQDVV